MCPWSSWSFYLLLADREVTDTSSIFQKTPSFSHRSDNSSFVVDIIFLSFNLSLSFNERMKFTIMVLSSISQFWGQGCYLLKTPSLPVFLPLTHTYTHSRPLSRQISPIQSRCWDWQDWQITIRALCALIKLLSDFREHLNMNVCCPAPIRHFLISAVSTSSSLCSVDGIIVTLMKNQWLCVYVCKFGLFDLRVCA